MSIGKFLCTLSTCTLLLLSPLQGMADNANLSAKDNVVPIPPTGDALVEVHLPKSLIDRVKIADDGSGRKSLSRRGTEIYVLESHYIVYFKNGQEIDDVNPGPARI